MKKLPPLLLAALALGTATSLGLAQIKEYTLPEMIEDADGAVYGEIIASGVFKTESPFEETAYYFTTLTLEGKSLSDGTAVTLDVTYQGGFLNAEEGYWNSEAPLADDVKVGNRVVAFYDWKDDLGGGVSANTLVALHGGLFRTVESGKQPVALGRGKGFAIEANTSIADLELAVRRLERAKKNR